MYPVNPYAQFSASYITQISDIDNNFFNAAPAPGSPPVIFGGQCVITVTAWLVRIPVAFALVVFFGMGAPGAWIGATTENIVRGGLIWGRFRSGSWKEKVV